MTPVKLDKYGTHILNLKKSSAYGVAARFAPGGASS